MQTLFGSLPAMAIENLPPLQTTMTMTSPDSATITQQATTADSVIIYVNATNGTGGDGENWGEAYNDLQLALDKASDKLNAGAIAVQIWLAQGTYTPTKEMGMPGEPRTVSFQLRNNVAIYGGFNGTETDVTARDWRKNPTILSGDIGTQGDNTDNAYHVFYHAGLNLNDKAILDGVTIKDGNANDSARPHNVGGGMYNLSSSPTLKNIIFENNEATLGGGMYNGPGSKVTLTNATFHNNRATGEGGAIYNEGDGTSVALINSLVYANEASSGSAVYNQKGFIFPSVLGLINVTMNGNNTTGTEKATIYGGVATIQNSIIVGNTNEPPFLKTTPIINNSLLDVNESTSMVAKLHKTNTDIGTEMYTLEQIFIDSTQQDYRLRAKSPAIDTGNIDDYLIFTNSTEDLAGNHRQVGAIDLGAYEAFPYDVTYEKNGATAGDVPFDKMTYNQGQLVTIQNKSTLERTGHTFAGWNIRADGQGQDYVENTSFTMGTEKLKLYAKWIPNSYNVTFDSNGGSAVTTQQVTYNTQASEPTTPSKQGHTFGGWYKDATFTEPWHFATDAVTEAITLNAKWTTNNYNVTFDSNGGSAITMQQVMYNTQASTPTTPSKQGHTFVGWYKDTAFTAPWNFATDVVTEAITLYAKWTTNPTYTVTYDKNGATGGTVPQNNKTYEEKDNVTVQGNSGQLVRTNYMFKGWNTSADGKGASYTANATFGMGQANVTLYAEWTAKPPTTDGGGNPITPPTSNDNDYSPPSTVKITLHTNGGTVLAPMEWTYNTKLKNLSVPTREGYRFDGWYRDEAFTKPWTEDTVVRENISLYAKWMALPVVKPTPSKEPQPTKPSVTFSDINKNHWAKDMIEELATRGIIKGYADGSFRPNEFISRMHVAVLLTRAFPFDRVREATDFTDVPSTLPYYEAITILQQAGIVDGSNGNFRPNENMTRAQLAKILVGVLGLTSKGTSSFADVDSTHWSTGYIAVLEREGIALGDNGNFRPNEPVTRAQFVAFLYRIMQKER